jgi:hypothetical protein
MTPDSDAPSAEALTRLIEQYREGLDAELALLRQLAEVSLRQGTRSREGNSEAFGSEADERDRLMRGLVTVEAGLRAVRNRLSEHREIARHLPGFEEVASLHRDAAALVSHIMATDQQSLRGLADAELAWRSAVAGLERGETTLAAYRRVLTPPILSPSLVDRRG